MVPGKKRFLKINSKKISKFNNKTSESGVLICDLVVIIVRESGGFMIFSRFSCTFYKNYDHLSTDSHYHRKASDKIPKTSPFVVEKERSSEFWTTKGQNILSDLLTRKQHENHAKNVCCFNFVLFSKASSFIFKINLK